MHLVKIIVNHFANNDLGHFSLKNGDQIESLHNHKKAFKPQEDNLSQLLHDLTLKWLSKCEMNTLQFGMNMKWPTK